MPASTLLLFGLESAVRAEVHGALAAAGHQVTEVSDAAKAIAQAADHAILVVDAVAGEDAAAGFCRAVRAQPALASLPILAIAQSDDVEERVRLFEAGADEVVARPFDPRELQARLVALQLRLGQTPEEQAPAEGAKREHRIIAVFSPKGGTGTTTIAVNVALALAHHQPGTIALIDLDTQFGQVATHLNVTPIRTIAQLAGDEQALDDPEFLRSYASSVEPGLDVYAAPATPAHAELVTPEAAARFLRTARSAYEVVVVDAGSHLDATTLEVFDMAGAVVVVVRPEIAALRAVISLIDYLTEIGSLGSRAIFVVNHLFGREMVKLRDVEEILRARIAVEIPHDASVFLRAVNEGVPVIKAAPRSLAAQRLARVAAISLGEPRPAARPEAEAARRGLIGRLRLSR